MFISLTARIVAIGLIVVLALGSLAGLLADASYQASQSFQWAAHSAQVIETTEAALNNADSFVVFAQGKLICPHCIDYANYAGRRPL